MAERSAAIGLLEKGKALEGIVHYISPYRKVALVFLLCVAVYGIFR